MTLQPFSNRQNVSSNGDCLSTAINITGKILLGAGSWTLYFLGKALSLTATGVGFVAAQGFKMLADANRPTQQQQVPLTGRAAPRLAPAVQVPKQAFRDAFIRHLTASFGQFAASPSFTTASRAFDALLSSASDMLSPDEVRHLLSCADQAYDQLASAAKQPGTPYLSGPACASAKTAVKAMRGTYLGPAPFDANHYQQAYARCFPIWDTGGRDAATALNGEIYAQTMQDIQDQRRFSPQKFSQMIRGTRHISTRDASQINSTRYQRPSYTTTIQFINQSTFDAAADMLAKGLNPLVLNMANRTDRGGAPKRASAQEETLCRQSALIESLNVYSQGQDRYPTPIEGGILSPQVPVFRHGPDRGYAYRDAFYVDVFACAAYNCNVNHARGYDKPATAQAYEQGTKEKMRLMARVAIANGNDSLLLSAFGCGAFQNNPAIIARWYTEVLNETEFRGAFKNITFAIIDMGATRNLDTFRQTMHGQLKDASFV